MTPLAIMMALRSEKLFERYGVKQPFTIIIKVGKAISQKMSKSFFGNFFETYGKLHSFTVIMTAEEVNL